MRVSKIALSVVACVLALGGLSAKADTIYDLSVGNPGISSYPANYGTVDVKLVDSTHATITFTAFNTPSYQYLFGDGGSVAVNVNATAWTLGSISGTRASSIYSDGGSGNEDGFGSLNQTINSFDGYGHSSLSIVFTLTDTSGTWATSDSVLVANANHTAVAAHIFVASNPIGANALSTGFAAGNKSGSPTPQAPDGGSTVTLLGLAMLGLGALRRTFSRN